VITVASAAMSAPEQDYEAGAETVCVSSDTPCESASLWVGRLFGESARGQCDDLYPSQLCRRPETNSQHCRNCCIAMGELRRGPLWVQLLPRARP
jgi:hypothetical protein